MARSLAIAPVEERADDWVNRLSRCHATTRLLDLYMGDAWSQAKRLASTARDSGFAPTLFVASAGLGLRSIDELTPSYAATFARGNLDTVAGTATDSEAWWSRLPHTPLGVHGDEQAVWVLSETYARAMRKDTESLDPGKALVFGGAASTPATVRVPSDRHLRKALGGTITTLNMRMAIRWLELAGMGDITAATVRRNWERWAQGARRIETFDRMPLTDDAVRQQIRRLRDENKGLSKTAALRALRASGIACEQRRFSALFEEVRGS
ncbi:MAG: hypothetical protein EOO27_09605 [Comamonadaceae bacterium]|nr:MAG: hypothetical protein EOO27_09605 [Comamonadaceae bacterium]